ncbi:MAG: hypothetical protein WC435_03755 [Candidatus Paceibacterota bacterium]
MYQKIRSKLGLFITVTSFFSIYLCIDTSSNVLESSFQSFWLKTIVFLLGIYIIFFPLFHGISMFLKEKKSPISAIFFVAVYLLFAFLIIEIGKTVETPLSLSAVQLVQGFILTYLNPFFIISDFILSE